ncbi:MAG: hypothetical protein ABI462_11445 [Ignavibacteria bacterium]
MKKVLCLMLLSLSMMFLQSSESSAGSKFDPKLKFKSDKNFSNEIKQRDYDKAMKWHKKIAGSVIGASIDFQAGYGSTSANGEPASGSSDLKTTSKSGLTAGAMLNVNLLSFGFSTGLDFTKKNFGITLPSITGVDSTVANLSNNYINIPINLNFGGMVSDKVGVYLSGGPYLGFLLNAENAISGFKDFDFGLNGVLTGKYYLNPFVAIILGTKAQYGGLNNLISSSSVQKLHTFNLGGFTGVSVGF